MGELRLVGRASLARHGASLLVAACTRGRRARLGVDGRRAVRAGGPLADVACDAARSRALTPWPRRVSIAWSAADLRSAGIGADCPCSRSRSARPSTATHCSTNSRRLRAWQAATGVVRACAPLPVETSPSSPPPATTTCATSRWRVSVLDNVDAHPGALGANGREAVAVLPAFGANDIDGVPARDDMPHGPRRAILEEVRRNLAAASLEPVERDGAFRARGAA